jgi:hypothetical protein
LPDQGVEVMYGELLLHLSRRRERCDGRKQNSNALM